MMDFYTILNACYFSGIPPFALYSQMSDLCKGDLKLKEQAKTLYGMYKQADIFDDLSTCSMATDDGRPSAVEYIHKHSSAEQRCLWAVARLLHPDWVIPTDAQSKSAKLAKAPQRPLPPPASPRNGFQNTPPVAVAPVLPPQAKAQPSPKKKAQKTKGGETLYISNMLSDLVIETSAAETDFHIQTLQNGVWTDKTTGIGKHGANVYINLEGTLADEIRVLLPQKKYGVLYVDKVHGKLRVSDRADCFAKVRITHESGQLQCEASSRDLYIGGRATEIELTYTAHRSSNVEIRNTLGDVRVVLRGVDTIQDRLFAVHGKVNFAHTSTGGYPLMLKVITNYGNVDVT